MGALAYGMKSLWLWIGGRASIMPRVSADSSMPVHVLYGLNCNLT